MHYVALIWLFLQTCLTVPVDGAHPLPRWYSPGVNAEAKAAVERMIQDAAAVGIKIDIDSDYRSPKYQRMLYEMRVRDADIAPPGYSEHQLGTAYDLKWPGKALFDRNSLNLRMWRWLENHVDDYGFVISYPYKVGDEWPYNNYFMGYVTEYRYEPWHVRYVGEEVARRILESGYLDPESPVLPQHYYLQFASCRAGGTSEDTVPEAIEE